MTLPERCWSSVTNVAGAAPRAASRDGGTLASLAVGASWANVAYGSILLKKPAVAVGEIR